MIEQLIVLGIATITLTAGTLFTIYIVGKAKRKVKHQKLDELHHRKMQILDEIKKEIEVESRERQKAANLMEVYDIKEVQNEQ